MFFPLLVLFSLSLHSSLYRFLPPPTSLMLYLLLMREFTCTYTHTMVEKVLLVRLREKIPSSFVSDCLSRWRIRCLHETVTHPSPLHSSIPQTHSSHSPSAKYLIITRTISSFSVYVPSPFIQNFETFSCHSRCISSSTRSVRRKIPCETKRQA